MNFSNITDWTITEGTVKQVTDSLGRVIWQKQTPPTPENDYFYVEDITGAENTLSIVKGTVQSINVYKSTDQINWSLLGWTDTTPITATIPANGRLYLKANDTWGGAQGGTRITTSGWCNVGGNIMSLLNGDNFYNTTLTHNFCLRGLLSNEKLISAANLVLPSNTTENCYDGMFSGCTSLISAPALPATTLTDYCYYMMFAGCTSLVNAPVLPATTLANYCYNLMFRGCTALTTAPTLPATTLARSCYQGMFSYCTSLVNGAYMPPSITLAYYCCSGMYYGCSALETAPTLFAHTLEPYCYQNMFYGCYVLNHILIYATDISATDCLKNWLYYVSATGRFDNFANPAPTYPANSPSGIPTGWTEYRN